MSSVTTPEVKNDIRKISRREFMRLTGVGSTGLVMGICLPGFTAAASNTPVFSPNLFIHIPEQGPIGIVCHRSEMGQGIRTGILQLIADELLRTHASPKPLPRYFEHDLHTVPPEERAELLRADGLIP